MNYKSFLNIQIWFEMTEIDFEEHTSRHLFSKVWRGLEVCSSKSIFVISNQIWMFKNDLWFNLYLWLIAHRVFIQNHQNQREIFHYLVWKYFGSVTHSGQDFYFLLSHFNFFAEDLADSSKIDTKWTTIQFSNVKSDSKWWS